MNFYLSELIDAAILNQSREKIGALSDMIITDISKPHPIIKGFVIKRDHHKDAVFIPEHDLANISHKQIKLSTDVIDLSPFIQRNDEILLVKEVFDKQIVDINDRRLTRVNDLMLEIEENVIRLKGVDISVLGIMNRIHVPNVGEVFKRNIVDWGEVQFLGGPNPMKFNVQYKNLESLHPVDIARIIFEGPGYKQGSRVLSSLKDPIAADILEELSPKLQENLIQSMKIEDIADVIEHMPPHKAADILIILGPDFSQKILASIKKEHADKILNLMNYPSHTTGAYMTIDYIAVPSGITLQQAFEFITDIKILPDFVTYFYVLENKFSNKLLGVVSPHEFYKSDKRNRIEVIMKKNTVVAYPQDHIKDSLKKMYRYNLSALPVVSKKDNKLLGIVTFRDAISIYLPKRWKVRIRQVFANGSN